MSARAAAWLARHRPPTPCLALDLATVAARYRALAGALPGVRLHYAVKANPEPAVLARLAALGAGFDVASPAEAAACLAAGAPASRLSYGSTVKKEADIAWAWRRGVGPFAFDCEEELAKIARAAPGAPVLCRIMVGNAGADWPLSQKFGCPPGRAGPLLRRAAALGLDAAGLSFHVGSQQRRPESWEPAIAAAAGVFRLLAARGLRPTTLNLGGGFPSRHAGPPPPPIAAYGARIAGALRHHFGDRPPPVLMAEPGRFLVGDAGVIESQVVLVSRRLPPPAPRWVYLDVGRFSGLAETEGEAIRYRLRVPGRRGPASPAILAGPSCDGADVLYARRPPDLPASLAAGDRVRILSAGAYTSTYAAPAFNGLPPPTVHVL